MKKIWMVHVAGWIVYLLLESYIEFLNIAPSLTDHSQARIFWIAFITELLVMPVKIALVYSLIYVLFPPSGKPRGVAQTSSLVLSIWFAAIVIRRFTVVYIASPLLFGSSPNDQPLLSVELIYYSAFELFPVAGVGIALAAIQQHIAWRAREATLVNEKLESELKFLKAQINPHFLFNTLNNIYGLARKQSEKTADAVLKLSKLMRFVLYEARKDRITLAEEIKLINDYVELERLRYTDRLHVEFSSSLDDPSQQIAPLLLIHFVENAFKHGMSESRFESKVIISVQLAKGILQAHFENSLEGSMETHGPKIGLVNTRRQLELLYPNHSLVIDEGDRKYSVSLTIPLR